MSKDLIIDLLHAISHQLDGRCVTLDGEGYFIEEICESAIEELQKEDEWKSYQQSRFYGIDDDGEPIFRDGCNVYTHRKCGWRSVIKSPYCPKCGMKMN